MYPNPTGGMLETYSHPAKRQRTYHDELMSDINRIAKRKRSYDTQGESVYKKGKYHITKKMPRKLNYRRRFRKRRRGIIRKRLPRSLTPRTKIITCKVVESEARTHTSGALERLNVHTIDITDPFGTGSTAQPLGYDQWRTLYDKAKVLGVKVKFTVHNSGSEPIMMGMNARYPNNISGLNDWEYQCELPGTVSRILSQDIDHGTLSLKRSTKKLCNIANLKDAQELECDLNTPTAPTIDPIIECWTQPFDKATATDADAIVEVTYIVLLYDPIIPARSTA